MDGPDPVRRPRKAAGPARPTYLRHDDIDRVMATLLALISEVAAIRERLDTHERMASAGASSTPEGVEAYFPEPAVEAAREAWREGYLRRLFRVLTEDAEALRMQSED